MKCAFTVIPNMLQSIDVAKVNVQICICRELCNLLLASAPLVDGCIKLTHSEKDNSYGRSCLTAVATKATIGIGTS